MMQSQYRLTCASLNWSVFTTTEVSKYSLYSTEAMLPYEVNLQYVLEGIILHEQYSCC